MKKKILSRNKKTLDSFVKYCEENKDLRFWQALRNWSGYGFIFIANSMGGGDARDTFYWEGRGPRG